jgi:hypothetical protein
MEILGGEVEDIYPVYATLRQAGSVVRDATGISLLSRHRLVAEVLARPDFVFDSDRAFPGAQPEHRQQLQSLGFGSMMMFRNGQQHRAMRRTFAPLFSAQQLSRIKAHLEATAATLIARLLMRDTFDLISELAEVLPIHALAVLFGLQAGDIAALVVSTRKAARLLAAEPMRPDEMTESLSQAAYLREELQRLLCNAAAMRKTPHPLDDLLLPDASAPFSREEILANLLVILLTGYDTSALTLGMGLTILLGRPDVCQVLSADPGRASRVADELIRYDSAGQVIFRQALEDTTLDGHPISRGNMVALFVGAANRDPDEFEQPDDLIFDRKAGRPVSFGAGPHACIGAALARFQLTTLLNAASPHLAGMVLGGAAPKARQRGLLRGYDSVTVHRAAGRMQIPAA